VRLESPSHLPDRVGREHCGTPPWPGRRDLEDGPLGRLREAGSAASSGPCLIHHRRRKGHV